MEVYAEKSSVDYKQKFKTDPSLQMDAWYIPERTVPTYSI